MQIKFCLFLGVLALLLSLSFGQSSRNPSYPWLEKYDANQSIETRITVPNGYTRVTVTADSFAHWLRGLPLKKGNPPVYLFNGKKKENQTAQAAVVDMDVGNRDLQQCADAVIRLRAEYLFSRQEINLIAFNFTSGHPASLKKWQRGFRPRVRGTKVRWLKKVNPDNSYQAFRGYLNTVFMYAGSFSLSRELVPIMAQADPQIGDIFIQAGFPGHAVVVVDMARGEKQGDFLLLLVQSYMPAQEVHLLKNLQDPALSPWYKYQPGRVLVTPEWSFEPGLLRRFKKVNHGF